MNIQKWIIAHFSPTGGTRKVAEACRRSSCRKRTLCQVRVCAGLCPVGTIAPEDPSRTNHDLCINCMRCVGACPVSSRALPEEFLNMITQMLNQSAAGYKKPAIFL